MGVLKPELIIKSIVPVVMAGILGIYGLIVAVILFSKGKLLNHFHFSYFHPHSFQYMKSSHKSVSFINMLAHDTASEIRVNSL